MTTDSIAMADKNIVQRRTRSNAARNTLGKPASRDFPKADFARELLVVHAKTCCKYVSIIALTLIVGAWLASQVIAIHLAGAWLMMALIMLAARLAFAKKVLRDGGTTMPVPRTARIFAAIEVVAGFTWVALFALLPFQANQALINSVMFAGSLVLMALALNAAHNLRYGVVLFGLPIATYVGVRLGMSNTMVSAGMASIVMGACFFLEHLAAKLRGALTQRLQSEVVRDQLIVELEAATAISDEARRRAEEANLAKSRFLATMSHELRTPLNAILGFSEVMSNEVMGPLNNAHYKDYVKDIHSSGSHLLNLINEILDLSRVEAGRYEMNEEPVSLTLAAQESRQMVKLKASQKNIRIEMLLQPDLPEIRADARAIRQIILNLLSNALKFTPEQGTIFVKVGWTAGWGQYISIKDTGPGIAEDEIPIVLSAFGQGSIAIKSAEQGTGLGLPIVQALVHMHNGHFELKSKLREGTEVIALFPRARVIESGSALAAPTVAQQNRTPVQAPPLAGGAGQTASVGS